MNYIYLRILSQNRCSIKFCLTSVHLRNVHVCFFEKQSFVISEINWLHYHPGSLKFHKEGKKERQENTGKIVVRGHIVVVFFFLFLSKQPLQPLNKTKNPAIQAHLKAMLFYAIHTTFLIYPEHFLFSFPEKCCQSPEADMFIKLCILTSDIKSLVQPKNFLSTPWRMQGHGAVLRPEGISEMVERWHHAKNHKERESQVGVEQPVFHLLCLICKGGTQTAKLSQFQWKNKRINSWFSSCMKLFCVCQYKYVCTPYSGCEKEWHWAHETLLIRKKYPSRYFWTYINFQINKTPFPIRMLSGKKATVNKKQGNPALIPCFVADKNTNWIPGLVRVIADNVSLHFREQTLYTILMEQKVNDFRTFGPKEFFLLAVLTSKDYIKEPPFE